MQPIQSVIVTIVALLVVALIVMTLRRKRRQRHDVEAAQATAAVIPLLSQEDIAYRLGLGERPEASAEAAHEAERAGSTSTPS